MLIGRHYNNYFDGIIDEARWSKHAHSADWIKTSYDNQSSPATFMTSAAEKKFR